MNTRRAYYYASDTGLTVLADGQRHSIGREAPGYDELLGLLRQGVLDIDNPKHAELLRSSVFTMGDAYGTVELREGYVTLTSPAGDTYELSGLVVERLMNDPPGTTAHLYAFLRRCAANPRPEAILELYDFLSATDLPITADGCFLAYKRVRGDYKDLHTGTIRNAPGDVVEMPREEVDDDRNVTCSSGLHFAGRDYLDGGYGAGQGNVTVVVKIDPADVVAIPVDYGNQKGRACRYKVLSAIDFPRRRLEAAWVDDYAPDDDDDWEDDE